MRARLVEDIRARFEAKPTDELAAIWKDNDRITWSEEAFEAIRLILLARGVAPPAQQAPRERQEEQADATQPPRRSPLAVLSLVLGIVSLWLLGAAGPNIIPLLPASMAAIVCGHLATRSMRRTASALRGRGVARAGLVLGYLTLFTTLALPLTATAREHARQRACLENVRRLVAACRSHAERHAGQFPATFEDIGSSEGVARSLICPASHGTSEASYELVFRGNLTDVRDKSEVPLIRETQCTHGGKRAIGYLDGRVLFAAH